VVPAGTTSGKVLVGVIEKVLPEQIVVVLFAMLGHTMLVVVLPVFLKFSFSEAIL
jgi:hypothetical protein